MVDIKNLHMEIALKYHFSVRNETPSDAVIIFIVVNHLRSVEPYSTKLYAP